MLNFGKLRPRRIVSSSSCCRQIPWLLLGTAFLSVAAAAFPQRGYRTDPLELWFDGVILDEIGPFGDGEVHLIAVLVESKANSSAAPAEPSSVPSESALTHTVKLAGDTLASCGQFLSKVPVQRSIVVLTRGESSFSWAGVDEEISCLDGDLEDNALLAAGWAPGNQSTIWLIGPGGEILGRYGLEDLELLYQRAFQIQRALPEASADELARQVVESGGSWRVAFEPIVQGVEVSSPKEQDRVLRSLEAKFGELDPTMPERELREATVCASLHGLLAAQWGKPCGDLAWRADRALLAKVPELRLLDRWIDKAEGIGPPGAYRKWLDRVKAGKRARILLAAQRLQLRDQDTLKFAMKALGQAKSRQWQVKVAALGVLSRRISPGFGDREAALELTEGLVSTDRSSESRPCRVAWTEFLGTIPLRAATEALLDAASDDQSALVRNAAFDALQRTIGADLGRSVKAYGRWLADRPEGWTPTMRPLDRWRPPAPLLIQRDGRPSIYTDGSGASETMVHDLFETESDRVVFVLDRSSSMEFGYEIGVVRELEDAFDKAPATLRVGLVTYAEDAEFVGTKPSKPSLVPLNPALSARFITHYRNSSWNGKTDFAAALEAAFEYEDVEEIVLLSDGRPTHGDRQTVESLVALLEDLNALRRVRISTVLMCPGNNYFIEELNGAQMPLATDAEIAAWTRDRGDRMRGTEAYKLLSTLAEVGHGTCRLGFANRLWSRNGVPRDD